MNTVYTNYKEKVYTEYTFCWILEIGLDNWTGRRLLRKNLCYRHRAPAAAAISPDGFLKPVPGILRKM